MKNGSSDHVFLQDPVFSNDVQEEDVRPQNKYVKPLISVNLSKTTLRDMNEVKPKTDGKRAAYNYKGQLLISRLSQGLDHKLSKGFACDEIKSTEVELVARKIRSLSREKDQIIEDANERIKLSLKREELATSAKISIFGEATSPDNHMSMVDRRLNIMSGGGTSSNKATLDESASAKELKKDDAFMLEFNGATSTRKSLAKDVAGYIANVGRSIQQRTGSRTLDFYLANESSSTQIFDDPNIPTLKELRSEIRYKLKLRISDATAHVVVVIFDETASELVKCSADSLAQSDEESVGSSTIDVVPDTLRSLGNGLHKKPSMTTLLKPCEWKTPISQELEDSDADSLPVRAGGKKKQCLSQSE
ncbi:cytochrome b5-like protein [Tanacetum coccineum]